MCWRDKQKTSFLLGLALMVTSLVQAQDEPFPYELSKRDWWLAPTAISLQLTGHFLGEERDRSLTLEEIQRLQKNDINAFDRIATRQWNKSLDDASDIILRTVPVASSAIVIPQVLDRKWKNAITLGVMYWEVYFFNTGITSITKSLVGRTRPYLYNTRFTPEERFELQKESPVANTSFISGHTSSVFAFAVFASTTFTDIYGKGTWSTVVWVGSMSLAGLTAYGRVAGGEHFPTDVIGGALVGSAVGYLIPMLHRKKESKLSVSVMPGAWRLTYHL
jgi:membrane-associated phospholipid phosphatase